MKRLAVLRSISSKCNSASLTPQSCSIRSSCSSSPSTTIICVKADQQIQGREVPLAHGHPWKACMYSQSPGQHRSVIAPDHVDRRLSPATSFRQIDNVVVHQRGGVDHFDHRRHADQHGVRVAQQCARKAAPGWGADACRRRNLQVLVDVGDGAGTDATDSRPISRSTFSRGLRPVPGPTFRAPLVSHQPILPNAHVEFYLVLDDRETQPSTAKVRCRGLGNDLHGRLRRAARLSACARSATTISGLVALAPVGDGRKKGRVSFNQQAIGGRDSRGLLNTRWPWET